MKIGIFTPYLKAYGGGEKYICKIAEILSKKHYVEFIVTKEFKLTELENKLNVNLNNVNINKIYMNKTSNLYDFNYLHRRFTEITAISKLTKNYNIFINQEHFSIIPSYASKSYLICEVPPRIDTMFLLNHNPFTNLIFDPWLKTYNTIITNSYYTKQWVENIYTKSNKNILVLYPPVDDEFRPLNKENIILNVGRFFVKGHSKKQLEIIKFFKQIFEQYDEIKRWELHLVGSVHNYKKDQTYIEYCKKESKGYPIYFHINTPYKSLLDLYGKAKIYWHATGFNINEHKYPDKIEHFGITTIEAMKSGCVPIVINKGGQKEIVRHNKDGYLWNDALELKKSSLKLIKNENLWEKMSKSSIERSRIFGMKNFDKRVKKIFSDNKEE